MRWHPSCVARQEAKASRANKEGGGAPAGASISDCRTPKKAGGAAAARQKIGTARLAALHRGYALRFLKPQLGPGRASWNHRMQTGGPSPAPVQQAPCGPITRRTVDAQAACRLKSDELRPQEPHPLRQSASPVDVPHDERAALFYSVARREFKTFRRRAHRADSTLVFESHGAASKSPQRRHSPNFPVISR
jgi:hypothetical protein